MQFALYITSLRAKESFHISSLKQFNQLQLAKLFCLELFYDSFAINKKQSLLNANIYQLNLSLEGLSSINHRFQWLSQSSRYINYILLTRAPLVSKEASFSLLPFDLHVLSTPPAFTLSQDQTLHNQNEKERVPSLR